MLRPLLAPGMKNPTSLRQVLVRSLVVPTLLASPLFALTPAEFDSLRTKAERGNAVAQYNLGLAHADRREAIYDPPQAYAWLSLAAQNGTNGKALANLASVLTPEQLVEGKRRLALLTASPVGPAESASPIVADTPVIPIPAPAASPAPAPAAVAESSEDQKRLSTELAAAWKETEQIKAALNAQLADANKRVAIAEAALASKDKEIAALQSRLAEISAAPAPAAAAPIGISAELASLRSERDQLQASATAALAQLQELRSQNAKAAAEENSLREKLSRASAELAAAHRAQTAAESESASLKAAADRSAADRLAAAAQLETVTAELAAAKEAAKAAPHPPVVAPETNSADLRKIEELTATLATTQADLAAKQTEIGELKARITQLSTETPKSVVLKADPRVVALETERDSLAATVKSLETERSSLLLRLSETQASLAAATAPVAAPAVPSAPDAPAAPAPVAPPVIAAPDTASAEKLAELEKSKAETDEKLAAALRSFTLQQAEIERLQKSLAGIDGERASLATQLDATTTELATLRPQAAASANVAAEAATLREQLVSTNHALAEKTAALDTSNRALADARRTVDTATADLVATRDQLRQTQAQSAAFAVENQQLKTKLALSGSLPAGPAPSRPGAALPSISVNLPPVAAPAAPAPAPAVAEPAAPRIHTVASGDSLSKISKQYYGTAARWNDILQANKDVIRNPDALSLGAKLRIP